MSNVRVLYIFLRSETQPLLQGPVPASAMHRQPTFVGIVLIMRGKMLSYTAQDIIAEVEFAEMNCGIDRRAISEMSEFL